MNSTAYWRGAAYSVAFVGVWWFLANRQPTSTYHFAPALIAAGWVVIEGSRGAGLPARPTIRLAAGGFLVAVVATFWLESADLLQGPVFWADGPDAPVVLEHLLLAAVGAIIGAVVAIRYAARTPA